MGLLQQLLGIPDNNGDLLSRALSLNDVRPAQANWFTPGELDPSAFGMPQQPQREPVAVMARAPVQQVAMPAAPQPQPITPSPAMHDGPAPVPVGTTEATPMMPPSAQAPQQRVPSVPQSQVDAAQAAPFRQPVPGPTMGDRLGAFLSSGGDGSIAKGIGAATYGLDQKARGENATAVFLQNKLGLSPQEALFFSSNPQVMAPLLTALITDKQLPTSTKEYQQYTKDTLARGQQPLSLQDWDLTRRRAAAASVNNVNNQENAFSQEAGKVQAKRFGDILEKADQARTQLGTMRQLADIASRVQTGPQSVLKEAFGPIAQSLGFPVEGLSDLEAYNAAVQRLAPSMRQPGSGASSDYDARQFLSALPNLARSPDGNAVINQTFQSIAEVQLKASEIASRVFSKEITPQEGEKLLRELPDAFDVFKKSQPAQAAPAQQPAGQQQWREIAPGVRVRQKG